MYQNYRLDMASSKPKIQLRFKEPVKVHLHEINRNDIEALAHQLKLNLTFLLEDWKQDPDNNKLAETLTATIESTKRLIGSSKRKELTLYTDPRFRMSILLCQKSGCHIESTDITYIATRMLGGDPTLVYSCPNHYYNLDSLAKCYSKSLEWFRKQFANHEPTVMMSIWTIEDLSLCQKRDLHSRLTTLSWYLSEIKELLKTPIISNSEWDRLNFEHDNILENLKNTSTAVQEGINKSEQ